MLWAPLVFGDTAGNVIKEKSVAESWETSPDGKTYTFKLRKDAKYSDGSPIRAQDFENFFGYLAMMATAQAAGYRDNFGSAKRLLFDVQGLLDSAKDVPYNEFGATKVPGVKAIDDTTLQVTLNARGRELHQAPDGVHRRCQPKGVRRSSKDQVRPERLLAEPIRSTPGPTRSLR